MGVQIKHIKCDRGRLMYQGVYNVAIKHTSQEHRLSLSRSYLHTYKSTHMYIALIHTSTHIYTYEYAYTHAHSHTQTHVHIYMQAHSSPGKHPLHSHAEKNTHGKSTARWTRTHWRYHKRQKWLITQRNKCTHGHSTETPKPKECVT